MNRTKRIRVLAVLAAVVLLAGGLLFLRGSGFFAAASSVDGLRTYMEQFAPYTHLSFFLIQLLSVVLAPIPSNLTAGGVLFGTWPSFLLTFGAVVAGSLLVFHLARALGGGFVDRVVNRALSSKYLGIIRAKTVPFLVLAFLLPFFPDDMLCILAGLTTISRRRFFCVLVMARPWGLLFASALGGSSLSFPLPVLILVGVAGVLLFLAGMKYGDRLEQAVLRRLGASKKI